MSIKIKVVSILADSYHRHSRIHLRPMIRLQVRQLSDDGEDLRQVDTGLILIFHYISM